MTSSAKYRALSIAAMASALILSGPVHAVELFTTPEARQAWEDRQAAELKARKDRERADKAHHHADKDATTAGLTPQQPQADAAVPAEAPEPSAAGTIHGPVSPAAAAEKETGSTEQSLDASGQTAPKFSTPISPSLPAATAPDGAKPPKKRFFFHRSASKSTAPSAPPSKAQPAHKSAAADKLPDQAVGTHKRADKSHKSAAAGKLPDQAVGTHKRADKSHKSAAADKLPDKAARSAACAGTAASGSSSAHTRAGGAPTLAWINSDVEPKAVVLCVHGLGLHNKSYEDFGRRMAAAGIATYAVDVRGFGSWMNNTGNMDVNFEDCLNDVEKTLEVLHKVHPNLPVFILGESMGGAIALRATAKYPQLIDGLISCVPSGDRFKQGRTEFRVAMHFLGGANKQFDIGDSVVQQASESKSGAKDNQQLKEDWLGDSLNRKRLSAKELMQFQRFMNENHQWAKKIADRPVLMVQGADDALVKATGTLELLSNIPVSNKDVYLVVIRDAKHLIFEESQSNDQAFNAKVLRLVNGWIDDHLKKPAALSQAAPAP